MSISKNQRRISVDDLGSSKSGVEVTLSQVEDVLITWAQLFIKEAAERLELNDSVSSGELSKSMKFNVRAFGTAYALSISMADYYDFVNKGVKGVKESSKAPGSPYQFKNLGVSKKFRQELSKWIIREGLKTRIKKEARTTERLYNRKIKVNRGDMGISTLAMVIGRSIKRKGLKATHFLDDTFEERYPELKRDLAKALSSDISINIVRSFYDNN